MEAETILGPRTGARGRGPERRRRPRDPEDGSTGLALQSGRPKLQSQPHAPSSAIIRVPVDRSSDSRRSLCPR